MPYIEWEQYCSLYNDISEKSEFEALEKKAEIKIDATTHLQVRRFLKTYDEDTATDFHKLWKSQIEQTAIEVVHQLKSFNVSGAGQGIASVSNEGYSVSFSQTDLTRTLNDVIMHGLMGTGLQGVC